MDTGELLPGLSLITLIIGAAILAILFALFMRKRKNRHPMDTPEGEAAEEMRRRQAEEKRGEDDRSKL
ncbi:hypothetical protein [Erythrobacter sp.]|uniref:hypothetical protein n=1 Tax=Erythrobacter sp. TaxID=1042 RepID=UPI001B10E9F7|nr:hypothetical protein [Erythrobacter sp.]MBO6527093.1 hypothetical protein [Erythrobacter sp.]MBO6528973.1 hypothetical protein [Erythrobacter sp.]